MALFLTVFTPAAAHADEPIYVGNVTAECESETANEWHFIINQIAADQVAPATVTANWDTGPPETIALDGGDVVGEGQFGAAHYTITTDDVPATATLESATAVIYEGWSGQFRLSHQPCDDGDDGDDGDDTPAFDVNSVEVTCEGATAELILFRVDGDTTDHGVDVELLDGDGDVVDTVAVNFNDGVAGGQFDYPADATGPFTISIDHDGGSDTATVPAPDCAPDDGDDGDDGDQDDDNGDDGDDDGDDDDADQPDEDVGGEEVTAAPDIQLVKTASADAVAVGDEIVYRYVITNTGNVELTISELTDNELGDLTRLVDQPTLDVGESTTVTATHTALPTEAGPLMNRAVVVAFGGDERVTDADTAVVEVFEVQAVIITEPAPAPTPQPVIVQPAPVEEEVTPDVQERPTAAATAQELPRTGSPSSALLLVALMLLGLGGAALYPGRAAVQRPE